MKMSLEETEDWIAHNNLEGVGVAADDYFLFCRRNQKKIEKTCIKLVNIREKGGGVPFRGVAF